MIAECTARFGTALAADTILGFELTRPRTTGRCARRLAMVAALRETDTASEPAPDLCCKYQRAW